MLTEKGREQVQDLIRKLVVFREDLHDLEKTFSRLNNESDELSEKLDGMLNED